MQIHAILLAGGSGDRFGADMPKQFVRLAGEQILLRSLRTVAASGVDRVVIVAHPDWLTETTELIEAAGFGTPIDVVPGGRTRNESTQNGLLHLGAADDDIIVVHDAVRPLLPPEVMARAIAPIVAGLVDATDTVIPSADTLVIVEDDLVTEIPDRSRYRRGQTPQVFRSGVLAAAYAAAARSGDLQATDDCSLVLRYVPGARIAAVAGDEVNLKITTGIDLVLADRMLQMRAFSADAPPPTTASLDGARLYIVGGTNGIGQGIADVARTQGALVEVDGRSTGLDVRDYDQIRERTAAAADRLGGLDHVIVTAGVLRTGRVMDTDPGDLAETIDVNLTGSLHVARAAHPYLRASRGSLTFFASSSFTRGRPGYVAYSASKAAIVNVMQGLAEEWSDDGIRVNAVSPERTDTPMRRRAFPDESRVGMLTTASVAKATLQLVTSALTGQVFDIKRHEVADPEGAAADGAADGPALGVPAVGRH